MIGPDPANRAALEADQLQQLRRLVGQLLQTNLFYAPRLRQAGLDPQSLAHLDDFARLPFTTKAQLAQDQAQHPPCGSGLSYPIDHYTRLHQTSGTTSAPLRWLDTPQSWEWMLGHWRRVYREAGVGPGDRVFFAFSFGPFLGFWTAFEAAQSVGCLCIPGGGLSTAARLSLISEMRATVLCCTPTYALHLGEARAAAGVLAPVRRVLVAGEPGGSVPAVRRRIESLWPQARVHDHHGMTEVGPVSYEDPDRPGVLRVIETSYLAEVIDPVSLEPVQPGRAGELVLTTLGRIGSPLLRYRTGDLVRVKRFDDQTPPFIGLEGGVIGRVDDMVIVRGVNVYPSAVEDIARRFTDLAEYRVSVRSRAALCELEVEAEPAPACADPAGLAAAFELALRDALSLRIPVRAVTPGTLPRFEMKARRWVHQP